MLSQIAASSEDLDIWLDPRPRKQTQYYLLYTKQRKNQERDFYKTCFNWYNFYLDQINEELGVIFFSFLETWEMWVGLSSISMLETEHGEPVAVKNICQRYLLKLMSR